MNAIFRIALFALLTALSVTAAAQSPELKRSLAWQIALDREGFSPGLIDGKTGRKTDIATREYQAFAGLPVTGKLDAATFASLKIDALEPTRQYTLTAADERKVTGTTTDWEQKSRMPYLGYESLADLVAEKFQCSVALIEQLSGKSAASFKVGDTLTVPNIQPPAAKSIASIEVNLSEKIVRGKDERGRTVLLLHCSIAASIANRPAGETTVNTAAENPMYTFDPARFPEVRGISRKLQIAAGPRNPVGVFWIDLALPGYGIHGTPKPADIGKTGSKGCIRLANWDAARLGRLVRSGMPVKFV